ncbi:cation:proton antiporter domain-containing protein [Haloarchaeobius salinus]|uniref:cation:proton antiporter domain-containing protein n=1 Tax=Haloarchaeobius salinus TaxID=1198298 RepID=UPI00210D9C0D
MTADLLPVVAVVLLSGIGAHLLAQRFRVPSVLFYLVVGLVLGPELLGVVTLETFGDGLETIVGLAVAIIVFDGAFALRFERIREASTTSLRLVTVGALVMFLGTALVVRLVEGTTWELALLVGALLVATGPTVITPILEVITVREHVSAALETEGIVNDVTAAIGAVVVFETLLLDDVGVSVTAFAFVERFGVGVASGLLAAVVIYGLLRYETEKNAGPQAARFLTLSAAVGSFVLAETVATEAGIAAAATAGIALGNLALPHRGEIEAFARDLTLLVLGFVFISLASLIDVRAVVALGVPGLVIVAVVMLVIRPLVAGIATVGVEQFDRSERLFLAAMGPRGIIPASVATLFAIELATAGNEAAAQTLLGTVFIVILVTDTVEAGLARQIGSLLGVTPMRIIIIGGGRVGRALATRLERRGEFVVIVEDDPDRVESAREDGFTVYRGDGTETDTLADAGIEEAKIVVAGTGDDDVNLLVSQLAKTKFGVEDVYARVNRTENVGAFESLSVSAIDDPLATAYAIDNEIERPALSQWMTDTADRHDVQEIEVTAASVAGLTVRELHDRIPRGCLIAEIGTGADSHVPDADEVIELGDRVTFLGDSDAVRTAVERFHPRD